MAWLGIISLGMTAEVSVIILLGRAGTLRYEAGREPVPSGAADHPRAELPAFGDSPAA
jgi:hypothetical protein